MRTINKVSKALAEARREGYAQISVSELAHKTSVQRPSLLSALHTLDCKMMIRAGEVYVSLAEMQPLAPTLQYSDLTLKSAIYGDDLK